MNAPVEQISPEQSEARRRARPDEVVLLDCREPAELAIASIDGAQHIPMREIPGRCDELDAAKELIVFCHSGIRSASVAAYLHEHGFPGAKTMTGGIDAWSRTVDPGVPRY